MKNTPVTPQSHQHEVPLLIGGFEFDHLPDFLSDHTLMADAPSARISEHGRRWTQFVAGLWCDDRQLRVCYQLRYSFQKDSLQFATQKGGRLRVSLLMRADPGFSAKAISEDENVFSSFFLAAREQLNSMKLRLSEMGFSFNELVYDTKAESQAFACMKAVREVRQREMMVPVKIIQNEQYLVEPWMGMAGPFLVPIQFLYAQAHDVCLCINLRPISIKSKMLEKIADIARHGATHAGINKHLDLGEKGPRVEESDPQSGWLGRVYSNQLRRLSHQAFGCSALVLSSNETTCDAVSSALASSVNTETPLEIADDTERLPYSRAEVVQFDSPSKAIEAMVHVLLPINEKSLNPMKRPDGDLPHLRYAMDAAGAATVFRLPVNIRGGVPGIPVRQIPPDFNPGLQKTGDGPSILIGTRSDGGEINVPLKDFAKHALITGFTGTGKTNTVLHLLDQFWRRNKIPFLVIESAKAEYRGFIRVNDIPGDKNGFQGFRQDDEKPIVRIYTVGNESCSPFRLNPFELQPGVRLESHINRLQSCFEAAIPQGTSGGPVPSLLADALPLIYQKKGWSLLDEGFARNESPLLFPTMADLKDMLMNLLDKPSVANGQRGRGYSGDVFYNMRGFILGRVGALLQGSRGLMFNTQYSVPLDELFGGPTIIELNDLNEADKGLVVMFLLVMLREYREKNPKHGDLCHITVVEEAHNVLSNPTPGTTSEAQEKAVQAFCNMLAEIRSLGEGLIIADQSPQKLARDAIRNTNVQITHALRDSQDRNAIADCSLMTDEQRDYLGKIRTGWAATFFMGLEKATFVNVPSFAQENRNDSRSGRGNGFKSVTDEEVREHMQKLNATDRKGPLFDLCEPCRFKCKFRQEILKGNSKQQKKLTELCQEIQATAKNGNETELIKRHARASGQLAVWSRLPGNSDTLWCAAVHLVTPDFFGPHRNVKDYHHSLCNNSEGFSWALRKYPKRLQKENHPIDPLS